MPIYNKNAWGEAKRRIAETKRKGETALDLSDLDLGILPERVCRVPHLRFLSLNNNRLTELPDCIGSLTQLRELTLVGNCLTQLPNCLRYLTRLECLRLSHNLLTELPEWIGQLARLNRLQVNSNLLTRLPETIGQLAQLESLYLQRNQLTQLPKGMQHLKRLRRLYLHGNEALNIPVGELGPTRREVAEKNRLGKSPRAVLDYYFRARSSAKYCDKVDSNLMNIADDDKVKPKTICLIIVYFGKWPVWFPAFLLSCKSNPSVTWLFFTDCGSPVFHPPNVVFYKKTLSEMKRLVKETFGEDATLKHAYKVCDYKPAFGILFKDYLNEFDFWGHCDVDIIWGDIRKYATQEILEAYDVFSTRREMISGHFTLFRNIVTINQLFRQSSEFVEAARRAACQAFDEEGMTRIVASLARAGAIRVYWPKFLQNYADPQTDTPSTLPRYINKYFWNRGQLFDCTGKRPTEILYLHFMTWKKTLTECEVDYGEHSEEFYISYSRISKQPISGPEGS
jgi:hypothetical protein